MLLPDPVVVSFDQCGVPAGMYLAIVEGKEEVPASCYPSMILQVFQARDVLVRGPTRLAMRDDRLGATV